MNSTSILKIHSAKASSFDNNVKSNPSGRIPNDLTHALVLRLGWVVDKVEIECAACLHVSRKDKAGRTLRTEGLRIKVAEPPAPMFFLAAKYAPNTERMMRGVMIACGLTREDIERLLKERRKRAEYRQRLAS
jgi:hypothetical protein